MPHPMEVRKRAEGAPQIAELLKVDVLVESLSHMAGRKPQPDDIGEPRGHVVERLCADERLVGRGQQCQARAETGAENADSLVSSLRQPGDRAPRVNPRLAARLNRSRDVRTHEVVGASQLRGHARVMVRQAHAQGRHAEAS